MDNQDRIRDLQIDRNGWQSRLDELVLERAKLLDDQAKGYQHLDKNGVDRLPGRIQAADEAVLRHQTGLRSAEDRLERARNGEDV